MSLAFKTACANIECVHTVNNGKWGGAEERQRISEGLCDS